MCLGTLLCFVLVFYKLSEESSSWSLFASVYLLTFWFFTAQQLICESIFHFYFSCFTSFAARPFIIKQNKDLLWFLDRWRHLLVCSHCHSRIPQTECLPWQMFIFHSSEWGSPESTSGKIYDAVSLNIWFNPFFHWITWNLFLSLYFTIILLDIINTS